MFLLSNGLFDLVREISQMIHRRNLGFVFFQFISNVSLLISHFENNLPQTVVGSSLEAGIEKFLDTRNQLYFP